LHRDAKTGLWSSTSEVAYYVANSAVSACLAATAIRHHWNVENTLHYTRDVTFQEDQCTCVLPGLQHNEPSGASEQRAPRCDAAIAGMVGNTLECLVGAWLINRSSGGAATFNTSGGVTRFALISLSAATPISALIGVSSLTLAGYTDPGRFLSVWMTWWFGDVAGALVVTPVIILIRFETFDR
jgi:hypothetical protein